MRIIHEQQEHGDDEEMFVTDHSAALMEQNTVRVEAGQEVLVHQV